MKNLVWMKNYGENQSTKTQTNSKRETGIELRLNATPAILPWSQNSNKRQTPNSFVCGWPGKYRSRQGGRSRETANKQVLIREQEHAARGGNVGVMTVRCKTHFTKSHQSHVRRMCRNYISFLINNTQHYTLCNLRDYLFTSALIFICFNLTVVGYFFTIVDINVHI